jgi:hypothetical protein
MAWQDSESFKAFSWTLRRFVPLYNAGQIDEIVSHTLHLRAASAGEDTPNIFNMTDLNLSHNQKAGVTSPKVLPNWKSVSNQGLPIAPNSSFGEVQPVALLDFLP